jgi:hypothetical protein
MSLSVELYKTFYFRQLVVVTCELFWNEIKVSCLYNTKVLKMKFKKIGNLKENERHKCEYAFSALLLKKSIKTNAQAYYSITGMRVVLKHYYLCVTWNML